MGDGLGFKRREGGTLREDLRLTFAVDGWAAAEALRGQAEALREG